MPNKQLAQQSVMLDQAPRPIPGAGWSPLWFHLLVLLSSSAATPVAEVQTGPEPDASAAAIADLQRRNAELEQKLREAEGQLNQVRYPRHPSVTAALDQVVSDQFSAVDDLVLIRDLHGRCIQMLTPQAKRLGLHPVEILGKTLHETFSDEVANHLWNAMQRALQTQAVVQTGFYLRQGDQAAWFDARISPLGQQAGLWVVRDVTQYKQMEADYHHTQATVECLNHVNQQLEEWVRVQAEELAQAQSTLSLSEEQLRLALVAAKMGIWSVDLRTGEELWSAESEALFGFAPGEFDRTYTSFMHRIHPDDRALVEQQIDQACVTGDYRVDYRVVWPDHTVRWIATRGRVRYDDQDQPVSLSGIDLDMTDRQRQTVESKVAAAALKQSEELFRSVFDCAPIAIVLATLEDHRCIRANAAYFQMLGYPETDFSSAPNLTSPGLTSALVTCIHPDDLALYEAKIQSVCDGMATTERLELCLLHQSGCPIQASLTITLIRDAEDQPLHTITMIEDITARRQAEAALSQGEEQFRRMFEAAPLGIGLIDIKTHRLLRSNAAHTEITGFSREELQQMSLTDLTHPDDLDIDVEHMQQLVDGTISRYQLEKRFRRKNGGVLYGLLTATLLRDAEGHPHSCLGMVEDITDRKLAEYRLQASLREKDVLLKEIHHRVKNNLQIISSLLRMQSRQVEDAQTRSLLQDSQNRIQSMALIHEQLYQSPDLSQIDFKQYVEPLINNLFRAYGVSRRDIHVEIRTHEISLTLDYAIPCGLIINELISNSLKYAFPDCTGQPVDRVAPKIQIELQAIAADVDRGRQWALTVQDNGIGLEPDCQWEHMQSLGLRIVRNLVDQLHGTIQLLPISLLPSGGTCFHILFPAA